MLSFKLVIIILQKGSNNYTRKRERTAEAEGLGNGSQEIGK
jgi:hypothetical protein